MTIIFSALAALFAGTAVFATLRARYPERSKPKTPSSRQARPGTIASTIANSAASAIPLAREDENRLRSRLARAGLSVSPSEFYGTSLAFFGTSCAGALLVCNALPSDGAGCLKPTVFASTAVAAALAPRAFLAAKAAARKRDIEAALPTVLDMLAASVEAGLTFERSVRAIAKRRPNALSEELEQAERDVSMLGYTRSQALERMAARCGSEEVSLFASSVIASSRSGAPLANMLKSQARSARKRRFQRMEAEANKIPTKMVFPLAFLIMPSAFLIAVAPAIVSIAKNVAEVL